MGAFSNYPQVVNAVALASPHYPIIYLLIGGLEPWNFMTFPFSWEWNNHPN
jgi:hypothetical protein